MSKKCHYLQHKLTEKFLQRFSSEIDAHIRDTEIQGLNIRYAAKTKTKVFYLTYSIKYSSIQRNFKLGKFGEFTVLDIRIKALQCRRDVHEGRDPMQEFKNKIRENAIKENTQRSVKELILEYLEKYSILHKKPNSYKGDKSMANNYIIPQLGNYLISQLSLRVLSNFYDNIGKKSTYSMANHVMSLFSHFWNWCEKYGYLPINSNPCQHIDKIKPEKKLFKRLNLEEYKRLFQAIEKGKQLNIYSKSAFEIIALLAYTGCRCSEIKNLTRSEVDLENHFLRLKDSKTGAKSVPLGNVAISILQRILEKSGGQYIFPSPLLPNVPLVDIRKPWQFIKKDAGLEGLRIHDLRHSFASLGIALGQDLLTIKNLLGHT